MTSGNDEGWFLELEGRRVDLREGEVTLGRSRGCGVVLRDPSVSRGHALLSVRQGRVTLQDLRSSNGSYVNGKRLDKETVLEEGDRVVIGETELYLRHAARSAGGKDGTRTDTGEVRLYCPRCGLPIHGMTSGHCPGCGADLAAKPDPVENLVSNLVPISGGAAALAAKDLFADDPPPEPASFLEFSRARAAGAFDNPPTAEAPAASAALLAGMGTAATADDSDGADRSTAETKPVDAQRESGVIALDELPMSIRELAPPPGPAAAEPSARSAPPPPAAQRPPAPLPPGSEGLWNRLAGYFKGPKGDR